MANSKSIAFLLCLFAALAMLGCADGRPQPVRASGEVLLDGQPLRLGFVRVLPQSGRGASGSIEPDGRFVLSTYEPGDGCLPGQHAVEVTAVEFGRGEAAGIDSSANQRWLIPKRYADLHTSGLSINVDGPTDTLVLELHSK